MPDTVADRIAEVRERIAAACARANRSPSGVTLIAVTKGHRPEAVRLAIAAGITDIGENRLQEAEAKREALGATPGVTWHMIGHLQSNKVKAAIDLFDTIHSVDSIHLAEEISRRAPVPVPAFLEVNVAGERTKSGFAPADLAAAHETIAAMPNIELRGLMTVAPIAGSPETVRPIFRRLASEASALNLTQLSMGMTEDFEVAIEEGATHIRLGRAIFGDRE
ncbi:MAG: YggS family pyridoxal phosphate-dependent enzyme [Chloroflexota bacterium]